MRFEVLI